MLVHVYRVTHCVIPENQNLINIIRISNKKIVLFNIPVSGLVMALKSKPKHVAFTVTIHSFSILSDDRSKASSKTIPPHSAI
jgi:hypothetical protein